MKTKILDKTGKAGSEVTLPKSFTNGIRKDVLAKVFEAQKEKQPMGSKYGAGAGYSASGISSKKRHDWKGTYGKGISRVPRKIMSRHGASFNWIGATVTSARGGRRAHPPKAEENQFKKINKKELVVAFDSAFAGTVDAKSLDKKYGVSVKDAVVFNDAILALKTKEFIEVLKKVYGEAFEKVLRNKTQRAGKGKLRGRKYKSNAGLLFVIGSKEEMKRKGIVVKKVNELKIKDLSPNGEPGRFAAYSENAIKEIGEVFK